MRGCLGMGYRIGALLGTCAVVSMLAVAATAAPRESDAEKAEKQDAECPSGSVGKPMTERAQKQLLKAIEAMEAEQLDEAVRILERIPKHGLGPFGLGLTLQMRAGIAASKDDLEGAARFMTESVNSGGFCGDRLESARLQLGQLLTALERWDAAIEQLELVIANSDEPNGEAYYRIGLALYQAKRVEEALAAAQKAVEIGGANAREPWWLLLLQIHWDREEFAECLPILRRLVIDSPKRDYWLRLGYAYFELDRTQEALVAMQVADRAGFLEDETDQLRLIQMEFAEEIPLRAAKRLETAIEKGLIKADQKTLEILSNTWLAARDREKSIEPLEKAAAMSPDGRNWLRIAQIRAQLDDWKEVARTSKNAIDKGSLEDPGLAYLLLGMAHFNMKELEPARAAFTRALDYEKTRSFANNWLAATAEAAGTPIESESATVEEPESSTIQ